MKTIQFLTEKIDDELEDAEKYVKCALRTKAENPSLSELYYKLSLEEMKHVTMLHEEVVKIINDYKREHAVPEGMQILYDYLHARQIKWASKIKSKQESYK